MMMQALLLTLALSAMPDPPLPPLDAPTAAPLVSAPAARLPGKAERYAYEGVVPPGLRLVERSNKALLTAGLVTFGVSYGVSVFLSLVGALSGASSMLWFAVPLAGPFVVAAQSATRGNIDAGTAVFITGLGLVELAGATMTVLAFVFPSRWLEPEVRLSSSVTLQWSGSAVALRF